MSDDRDAADRLADATGRDRDVFAADEKPLPELDELDSVDARSVSPNTLTTVPEHLASLATGDATLNAERIVLKTAAGDVAIVARDGGLAVESA